MILKPTFLHLPTLIFQKKFLSQISSFIFDVQIYTVHVKIKGTLEFPENFGNF